MKVEHIYIFTSIYIYMNNIKSFFNIVYIPKKPKNYKPLKTKKRTYKELTLKPIIIYMFI